MIGDFFGVRTFQTAPVTTVVHGLISGETYTAKVGVQVLSVNPSRAAMKISEFESALPLDRAYISYNYFNNAGGHGGFFPGGTVFATNPSSGITEPATAAPIGTNRPSIAINRETFGAEKVLLDNALSIGVRVPQIQTHGDPAGDSSNIGDVSFYLKYALCYNPSTRDALSVGVVMTTPTGQNIVLSDGSTLNDFLFQPWVGYLYHWGDAYVQGFHGVVVPTETRDTTFMDNDFLVGYFLYRNNGLHPCISMVAPQVEIHVTTPLNHTGPDSLIPNLVVGTLGLNFGIGHHAILTLGAATPFTGPRPFDYELVAQMQVRF
jgi:hypothetical protein